MKCSLPAPGGYLAWHLKGRDGLVKVANIEIMLRPIRS